MPEMDGFELLKLVKDDNKLKDIPVIVMSADDINSIVSQCLRKVLLYIYLEMGATDYLVKPVRV